MLDYILQYWGFYISGFFFCFATFLLFRLSTEYRNLFPLLMPVLFICLGSLVLFASSRSADTSIPPTTMKLLEHATNDVAIIKSQQLDMLTVLMNPSPNGNSATSETKTSTTSGTMGFDVGIYAALLYAAWFCFAIFLIAGSNGISVVATKQEEGRKWLAGSLTFKFIGCALLSLQIGFTAIKADSFLKIDGLKINFHLDGQTPSRQGAGNQIAININDRPTNLECMLEPDPKRPLFPFADGTTKVAEDDLDNGLRAVRGWVNERLSKHSHLAGLILIGSADKRPLGPDSQRIFGDNQGLAMGRANLIARRLANDSDLEVAKESILTIYAGPFIVGDVNASNDLQGDRTVRLCAMWN